MVFICTDHSQLVTEEEAIRHEDEKLGSVFFQEDAKLFASWGIVQGWFRIKGSSGGGRVTTSINIEDIEDTSVTHVNIIPPKHTDDGFVIFPENPDRGPRPQLPDAWV